MRPRSLPRHKAPAEGPPRPLYSSILRLSLEAQSLAWHSEGHCSLKLTVGSSGPGRVPSPPRADSGALGGTSGVGGGAIPVSQGHTATETAWAASTHLFQSRNDEKTIKPLRRTRPAFGSVGVLRRNIKTNKCFAPRPSSESNRGQHHHGLSDL